MTTTRTASTHTEQLPSTVRQPQLLLITDDEPSRASDHRWAIDEETRETGRRGLARARAALQATRPPHLDIAA